jgi:hypothetical protein
MIDDDDCGAVGGMNEWQRKQKYSEKHCPSAALSAIDPTWFGPGCLIGKPVTHCLSYGTANLVIFIVPAMGYSNLSYGNMY